MAIQQLHYCTHCGTPLLGLVNFCQSCGYPLHPGPQSPRPHLIGSAQASEQAGAARPSFGQRGAAAALDAALSGAAALVALVVGTQTSVIAWGSNAHTGITGAPALAAAAVVLACYHPAFWVHSGQTPGMRVFGIRLSRTDGSPVSLPTSVLREAAMVVSAIPLGAGFAWTTPGRSCRTWHDRIAGTVLTADPRSTAPER
jgi:uncharacterized RDD family membrane protein YckC